MNKKFNIDKELFNTYNSLLMFPYDTVVNSDVLCYISLPIYIGNSVIETLTCSITVISTINDVGSATSLVVNTTNSSGKSISYETDKNGFVRTDEGYVINAYWCCNDDDEESLLTLQIYLE